MQGARSGALRRRAFLASIPAGLLAGCTSAEETPPGIGEIVLENRLAAASDVTLTFTQDGQEYETTATVTGLSGDGPNREVVVADWMGEHGDWELRVEAAGTTGSYESGEFDDRYYDYDETDCIQLVIRIEDDGMDIRPQTIAVECP